MADALPVLEASRHVLTAVEFDVLWGQLGLGPTPVALRLRAPGHVPAERRDLMAAGWPGLRERGLAGPGGPDPELARLLRLLGTPAVQLELRGSWGHDVRAIAAGRPGAGVLAVRQDATVTLGGCGSLPAGLLGVLPAVGTEGRAQIGAIVTDRCGVARRAGGVVGVLDTAAGRYLLTHGVVGTTAVPTDLPTLHERIVGLLGRASRGR